jgi:hypothetical protein
MVTLGAAATCVTAKLERCSRHRVHSWGGNFEAGRALRARPSSVAAPGVHGPSFNRVVPAKTDNHLFRVQSSLRVLSGSPSLRLGTIRTWPPSVANSRTRPAAPAGRKSRTENPAAAARSARPPVCPVACPEWVTRLKARCSTRRRRNGSPWRQPDDPAGQRKTRLIRPAALSTFSPPRWTLSSVG